MIGVRAAFTGSFGELKRAAMLCDSLVFAYTWERTTQPESWQKDLDWLTRHGIAGYCDLFRNGLAALRRVDRFAHAIPNGSSISGDIISRLLAADLSRVSDGTFIPILDDEFADTQQLLSARTTVIGAVLQALPVPDDNTPWQAILDWRSDEDAKRRFRRLLQWIDEVGRRGVSFQEAANEIATSLDDYETYMQSHHRRMKRGAVEVVVTTAAELLEDFATFKFSSAMTKLFSLWHGEVPVAEKELNAPGRQLAFISHARRYVQK